MYARHFLVKNRTGHRPLRQGVSHEAAKTTLVGVLLHCIDCNTPRLNALFNVSSSIQKVNGRFSH